MVPTLAQAFVEYAGQLARFPAHELRAIARALRLGPAVRQDRKAVWVEAIVQHWRKAAIQGELSTPISPAAQSALQRLYGAGSIPAPLFFGEYGTIRLPRAPVATRPDTVPKTLPDTPSDPKRDTPWRYPHNASEELYYRGLLLAVDSHRLAGGTRLTAPRAVAGLFRLPRPYVDVAPDATEASSAVIPQSLLFINRYLIQSIYPPAIADDVPACPTEYARFMGLLQAAHLLETGSISLHAWAFLERSPFQQLQTLWHTAHRFFAFTGKWTDGPETWLERVAAAIQARNHPPDSGLFQVRDVSHRLLGDTTQTGFLVAHSETLTQLDNAVEQALDLMAALGLLHRNTKQAGYGLTQAGIALLVATGEAPPWAWQATGAEWEREAGGWRILLPAHLAPAWAGQIACFGEEASIAISANGCEFTPLQSGEAVAYRLTRRSLARAAAYGYGLPTLWQALARLAIVPLPADWEEIQGWYAGGMPIRLEPALLMRTETASQMAALLQSPALEAALLEGFSPTVTRVRGSVEEMAAALYGAGHVPAPPAKRAEGEHSPPVKLNAPELEFLWLAGQLYLALGRHMALPLPGNLHLLNRLQATLPPDVQQNLENARHGMAARLLDLLDDLPFTPPPVPSEPDKWRAMLEEAIGCERRLAMDYFSPGRNLLTRRIIDPYWLVAHAHTLYLYAYCHQAGRALTFRLDRIEDLQFYVEDDGPADLG